MWLVLYDIGGFIPWPYKGSNPKLWDEINGNLDATLGSSYDSENLTIEAISTFILFNAGLRFARLMGWYD